MKPYHIIAVMITLALALMVVNIDAFIDPGGSPDDEEYYDVWRERYAGYGIPVCIYGDSDNEAVQRVLDSEPMGFMPGGGGDVINIGPGSWLNVYDDHGDADPIDHDTAIFHGVGPDDLLLKRHGSDLLICGRHTILRVVLIRQYCRDNPAWNNEIEEIVFLKTREVWLSDEIYDEVVSGGNYPSSAVVRSVDNIDALNQDWSVQRFSKVLPGRWLANLDCRKDVEGMATARAEEGASQAN